MILTQTYIADDGTEFLPGTEVQIKSVSDNYIAKQCEVEVRLTSETVNAARFIGAFPYVGTWEDEDVWSYIESVMS